MAITYRTSGTWGPGVGRNLTAAEVDANFATLAADIAAVVGGAAAEIVNITAVGTVMTIALSDGSSYDVDLPVATSTYTPSVAAVVSGATYTPAIESANSFVTCTNGAGCTITIPPGTSVPFEINTELHFRQGGGNLTFTAGTGVTLSGITGTTNATDRVGAVVTLKQVDADDWVIFGLLASS
jgi:hypothetical protein